MSYVLTIARLLLSSVFAVAGFTKLMDRAGSREALVAFGVPDRVARPLGILLPVGELATAALLLPAGTAWLGAIAAGSLLLCFLLAIGINLARGRRPNCHCFGQLHSAPVGWKVMARNGVLAGVAAFIVWHGPADSGLSAFAWWGDPAIAGRMGVIAGAVALAVLTIQTGLLLQLLKQQGRLLLRLDTIEATLTRGAAVPQPAPAPIAGLPVGTPAPSFELPGLRGETVSLEALVSNGKPVVLLFTNPHCGPCESLMPEVGRWQRELAPALTIAVVSEGSLDDNRARSAAHGVTRVSLQRKREIAENYRAWGTPSAVLVRSDGSVGTPLAQGADAIRTLVFEAAAVNGHGHTPQRAALKPGDFAPRMQLHDLDGATHDLKRLGRGALLLFWDPACGFCRQMLERLRQWESDPPTGAPRLILISRGTIEENRAMGLRSHILLDHDARARSAFGANGTPMALRLDADGRISSGVVAGAQAVFALAAPAMPEDASRPSELAAGGPIR